MTTGETFDKCWFSRKGEILYLQAPTDCIYTAPSNSLEKGNSDKSWAGDRGLPRVVAAVGSLYASAC